MGTAALVLGILAIVLAFIPILGFVSYPLAILGILFGLVGLRRVKKGVANNRGVALTGLIASIVGFVLVIISTVTYVSALNAGVQSMDAAINAPHNVTYQASSTNGGELVVGYSQAGGTASAVSVASPWSLDATVNGSIAILSVSTSPSFEDPNATNGVTCSIVDRDSGRTLVTNSVPAAQAASVSCNASNLGQ
jgi:hypothetical protein